MTDTTQAAPAQTETEAAAELSTESKPQPSLSPQAGLAGAAAFANAEAAEILNLLGDTAAGGSCCGGGCCSTEG